jgi:hypothetical protein
MERKEVSGEEKETQANKNGGRAAGAELSKCQSVDPAYSLRKPSSQHSNLMSWLKCG